MNTPLSEEFGISPENGQTPRHRGVFFQFRSIGKSSTGTAFPLPCRAGQAVCDISLDTESIRLIYFDRDSDAQLIKSHDLNARDMPRALTGTPMSAFTEGLWPVNARTGRAPERAGSSIQEVLAMQRHALAQAAQDIAGARHKSEARATLIEDGRQQRSGCRG